MKINSDKPHFNLIC